MFKILAFILAVYALLSLLLYALQRSLLYYPTVEASRSDVDILWLDNDGERLKVWKVNDGAKALLYFGGNAEAVEHNIDSLGRSLPEHTLYIVNYRGYGGSSGSPSEAALFSDALALYDAVASRHDRVDVIGRSLGSGVAVWLAARRAIDRLVLVTPYASITELAQSHYPLFPVRWLLKDRFDSISVVDDVSSPTLVLLSEHDATVPRRHSMKLVEALGDRVRRTRIFAGTAHNNVGDHRDYLPELAAFLD